MSNGVKSSDIYCDKILTGELKVEVLVETATVLAFRHTQPFWETHIVVIPKKHIVSLTSVLPEDKVVIRDLMDVAADICAEVETSHGGCRLSTNVGSFQTSTHLHFYVHAGPRLRNEDRNLVGSDQNHS